MTFLLRFIIVLAIAMALGIGLYYLVNALPNNVQNFTPHREGFNPQGNPEGFDPPGVIRPEGFEGRERGGEGGVGLFALVSIFDRLVMFAMITFFAVLIKNLFRKKPANKAGTTG